MKGESQEEFTSNLEKEIIEIKEKITFFKEQFEDCLDNIGKMTEVSYFLDNVRILKETLLIKEFELLIYRKYLKEADIYLKKIKLENERSIKNYKNNLYQ